MISMLLSLSAGNAVRVFVQPEAGATCWRILRRTADAFTGANDAGAVIVAECTADNCVVDTFDLVNGTPYFYHCYWSPDGETWNDSGASVSTTPAATYLDASAPDPQTMMIERLTLGLAVEVQRGALQPATGAIPVVSSPFALADNISFPIVSVHLDMAGAADRVLGEEYVGMGYSGDWLDGEGWLARVRLAVIGVSLNADERAALRMAIRRIIQANLPVFAGWGWVLPTFQQADSEDQQSANAPLFRTDGAFECLAPEGVASPIPTIADVSVIASPFGMDPVES